MKKEKSVLKTERMVYMGHLISSKGVEPDPQKIRRVTLMPAPTNNSQILTLQFTVRYLAKFLPHLSELTQPIRGVTKDDIEFVWGKRQEETLEMVKKLIMSTQY